MTNGDLGREIALKISETASATLHPHYVIKDHNYILIDRRKLVTNNHPAFLVIFHLTSQTSS